MSQPRSCPYCKWDDKLKWDESKEDYDRRWKDHRLSELHTMNYLKHMYSTNKSVLLGMKNDIEITCLEVVARNFKLVGSAKPKSTCSFTLAIKNTGQTVYLMRYEFLHRFACIWRISDEYQLSLNQRILELPPYCEEPYIVKLDVIPDHVGIYQSPLLFHFHRNSLPFYVGFEIVVSCSDNITQTLENTERYMGRTENDVLPPAPDIRQGPGVEFKSKFEINNELRRAIEELQEQFKNWISVPKEERPLHKLSENVRSMYDLLVEGLNKENYTMYFNLLLNMEEVQMDHDIRKYDMKYAVMNRCTQRPGLLTLHVSGLAEKRPSVLKGDILYVRIAEEQNRNINIEYQGFVRAVQETEVWLAFGKDLTNKYLKNMKFHVRFTYNKLPMQVMINALTMVRQDHLDHWLFPTSKSAATCPLVRSPTEQLVFYNRSVEDNNEQQKAIKHIVAGSSLPAPYLLHGPPGTGKTVTLVEAVLQLWHIFNSRTYKSYILICTPSNSASDLIAVRLLNHLPRTDILRFYSKTRELKQVPTEIQDKKCFNYDYKEDSFYIPTLDEILKYRVIVSTLCNSSRLLKIGVTVGHFTHIFVDESGHAVEPECLSPLVGLLECRQAGKDGFGGQIVLAGDHLQLGPVIRCRVALEFNLDKSLLERLMNLDIYQRDGNRDGGDKLGQFNPNLLTRLKNNYRSHPAILREPNRIFYDDELMVCADELKRESLCRWEGLPISNFPALFHGVLGRDMQEAKNPSYFNPQEVSVVINYVERLLTTKRNGLKIQPKDIGIISPYRQQVYKIRNELQKMHLNTITVGSVDEFQGQERRIIIISTVRSNPDLMTYDRKYRLGFLNNPKRFNVALTRAQCMEIVIGNPNLLSTDPHWNAFLLYCRKEGSYVGVRYDDPEDEVSDVIQRFRALHLVPVEREPTNISHIANQEDPEWRGEE